MQQWKDDNKAGIQAFNEFQREAGSFTDSFYELVNIMSTTWCYKVVMSIILLPVGIYIVQKIKKVEKTDYYDWGISYNPLKVFKGTNDDVIRNKFDINK